MLKRKILFLSNSVLPVKISELIKVTDNFDQILDIFNLKKERSLNHTEIMIYKKDDFMYTANLSVYGVVFSVQNLLSEYCNSSSVLLVFASYHQSNRSRFIKSVVEGNILSS